MVLIKNRLNLLGCWCTVKKRLSPLAVYSQHFFCSKKRERERYSWHEMKDHSEDQNYISLSKTCHRKETYVGSTLPTAANGAIIWAQNVLVRTCNNLYVYVPVCSKNAWLFFYFKKANSTHTHKKREQFNFYKQKKIVPERGEIKWLWCGCFYEAIQIFCSS